MSALNSVPFDGWGAAEGADGVALSSLPGADWPEVLDVSAPAGLAGAGFSAGVESEAVVAPWGVAVASAVELAVESAVASAVTEVVSS